MRALPGEAIAPSISHFGGKLHKTVACYGKNAYFAKDMKREAVSARRRA
jgi:hypothetical protein